MSTTTPPPDLTPTLPAVDLPKFLAAILDGIRAAFPKIKTATAYEPLDLSPHAAKRTPLPAITLELVDAPAATDIGTDQQPFTLHIDLRLLCTARGGAEADLQTRILALNIAAHLKSQTFGHPINGLRVTGVYPDYLHATADNTQGRNNASYLKCQRITIEADVLVGQSTWNWPEENVELLWGDGLPTDEYYPQSPRPTVPTPVAP